MIRFRTLILCAATLSACSGSDVKNTLGLSRSSPDEFRVVSRPPLSVPPDFELRPPAIAGTVTPTSNTGTQARNLLLGTPTVATTGRPVNSNATMQLPSDSQTAALTLPAASSLPAATPEAQFLKDIGAVHADPNVRTAIQTDNDNVALAAELQEEKPWWDIFSSSNKPKAEPVVDAQKEANRIKTDESQGQPVTQGATPDVKTKDTGLLGQIFGY